MSIYRIIDKRKKEKYVLDDEYLNGMARLCGWQGTIVYNSLCRHVDKDQKCFPSIKLISEQHNVNRKTIIKGIDSLERRGVIEIKKIRSKGGQWLNNEYTLLDKSEWNYDQVPVKDMVDQVPVVPPPSPSQGLDQVPVEDTKETHKQGNTSKETHTSDETSQKTKKPNYYSLGAEVIKAFEEVDRKNKTYYANKTQRSCAVFLIEEYGLDKVLEVISILPQTNQMPYIPKINSPYELKEKWQKLSDSLKARKAQNDIDTKPKWNIWT